MSSLENIREDEQEEQGDFSHAETDEDYELKEQAGKKKNKSKKQVIASKETRAVLIIRSFTILVLVLASVTTTLLVYAYAADQEMDDFEQAFYYDASKILDTYQTNAAQRLKALDSFSSSITQFVLSRKRLENSFLDKMGSTSSEGTEGGVGGNGNVPPPMPPTFSQQFNFTKTEFPFVTMPEFERTAKYTLESAEVFGLIFLPVVSTEQKEEWETYSVDNIDWLEESLTFQQAQQSTNAQEEQPGFNRRRRRHLQDDDHGTGISPIIYRDDPKTGEIIPETGPGPYYPIWQMAPALNTTDFFNFNLRSYYETEFDTVSATQRPLTTMAVQLETTIQSFADLDDKDNDSQDNNDDEKGIVDGGSVLLYGFAAKAAESQNHLDMNTNSLEQGGGIASNMIIPVFNVWNEQRREVAGVLFIMVYWQRYLDCLLPDVEETLAAPLLAILENTCNQAFTYEIRGSAATFVGIGDLHDPDYDDLMMESGFAAVLGFDLTPTETMPGECMYNVRIYPTEEMQEQYMSQEPYWFAAIVFFIFIFTALVFVLYDKLVQRRHDVVNTKAVESSAVVSSLFPEAVRDQVVGIVEKCNTTDPTSREFTAASAKNHGLGHYWKESPTKSAAAAASSSSGSSYYDRLAAELDSSAPIANLYPDCTVLFCDIAGFTAWSGKRGPSEVFKLLEAIYGAFDRIARKKHVFKVETIGDCYVAVTGLPQPQAQHAVIMTKFASDCMTALSGMMHVLVDKLGDDTATLTMRFGLHSGPVTAGVLRGERARFQLFGDTVNTASRMESNGQKGRIQVSQQTADLLIAAGKQHWVKPREDKIQAKGKGLLQTYWIELNAMTTSSSSSGTPRTSSLTGSVTEMGDATVELMGDQAAELSRKQHEEYKEIIDQIKHEVES